MLGSHVNGKALDLKPPQTCDGNVPTDEGLT